MEEILIPGWALILMVSSLIVLFAVMLLVYMPRAEEILKYKKRIKDLRKKIEELSKNATQATLEHTADVGELSEKLLAAEGKTETIRAEAGEKVAEANARTEQQKKLAEQFAKLYEDHLKRRGSMQSERN